MKLSLGSFTLQSCDECKEMDQNSIMHVQSCFFFANLVCFCLSSMNVVAKLLRPCISFIYPPAPWKHFLLGTDSHIIFQIIARAWSFEDKNWDDRHHPRDGYTETFIHFRLLFYPSSGGSRGGARGGRPPYF